MTTKRLIRWASEILEKEHIEALEEAVSWAKDYSPLSKESAERMAKWDAALATLRTPEEQMRPDFARCGRCGADSAGCSWDPVDGWCCSNCGGCDADE